MLVFNTKPQMTNYKLNRIFLSTLCSEFIPSRRHSGRDSPLLIAQPVQQHVILVNIDSARYAEISRAIPAKILGDKLV
ncbi:MAG: hypothetical protein KKF20_03665 [Bacteroidetes bacterium]|nr:hypothetical protein [Bacteroidota bacterium]MBU2471487.1 hypothetical protein [Bacteroidota bacterium]MBU2636192.1 hypothetical protein [Bacteroidota bacterium]